MKADFDHLARRQHSLVTNEQLHHLGWSRAARRWAIASGQLNVVRAGVLRPVGALVTREQAWMAALLAAGGGAVVSHATAWTLWGLPGFPECDGIDLLVEGPQGVRLDGVRGHCTTSLPASHRAVHCHIPVTTVARTLVDACGLVTAHTLEDALDHGRRRSLVRLPELVRVVDEVPISGRRRIKPVAALLAERVPGYGAGHSAPEVNLVKVLIDAGFERPQQQVRVRTEGRTYFIDVGWPERKVGYEYDSVQFHDTVGAFHQDRERLRRLQRAGWEIWPITSRTSTNEVLAIAALAFERGQAA